MSRMNARSNEKTGVDPIAETRYNRIEAGGHAVICCNTEGESNVEGCCSVGTGEVICRISDGEPGSGVS